MIKTWNKVTKIDGYRCDACGKIHRTKDAAIRCFDSHIGSENWRKE